MPVDIFATKGPEYLLVIVYFALLIGLARYLAPAEVVPAGARRRATGPRSWFSLADGYHFHPGHAWAAGDDGDVVRVGLDDFTAQLVGPPDRVELPAVGSPVRAGERGWTLRAGDRALSMLSPVDGEVVAVNPAVLENPRVAAEDPYGQGWLLKVRGDRRVLARNLLSGTLARSWIRQTADRLGRLPDSTLGVVMADGGTPVRGFGRALEADAWATVRRDFFLDD